ncbi:unnamed protein product [Mytilus coruscus]|uniref:Uncharacterized protein n=1 Tax=Mytilus coruscus TaxID=42192 RepID=A0A6J8AG76_MYTCO|nr:unnamed protein product [Mytilus coruscus]
MWTRFIDSAWPFIPNHFVPLLNIQPDLESEVVDVADNSDVVPEADIIDEEPVADIIDEDVSSFTDLALYMNSTTRSENLEMFKFLRNCRATKHATTEVSQAKVLFGRNIKTKLPTITSNYQDKEIRETDQRKEDKMKDYVDTRRNDEPSNLQIGDTVLVKQDKQNELSTL